MSSQLHRGARFYNCEFVLSNFVVRNCEMRFAEVDARVGSSRKSWISRRTELSLLWRGFSAGISIYVLRGAESAAFGAQRAIA
jgi:hypothetical protein